MILFINSPLHIVCRKTCSRFEAGVAGACTPLVDACLPASLPAFNHFALMPVTLCKEGASRQEGRKREGREGKGGGASSMHVFLLPSLMAVRVRPSPRPAQTCSCRPFLQDVSRVREGRRERGGDLKSAQSQLRGERGEEYALLVLGGYRMSSHGHRK